MKLYTKNGGSKMKKTRILIGAMILTLVALMYGCGGKTPTNTVEEYFKALQKGDTEVENLFLSSSEDNEELEDAVEEIDELSDKVEEKLFKAIAKLTYTVNSESINEDTATVNVTVEGIDLAVVMVDVIQESFTYMLSQVFSGIEMSEEESDNYFNTVFSEKLDGVTYSERSGDISLTKVDGEWKISENDSLTTLVLGLDSSLFNEDGLAE